MAKLSAEQIEQQLRELPGWEYKDNAIRKLYRFKQFMDGIRFINEIAEFAESIDHHPDIHVNYTRVTFICSTHDQGGVTEKDFRLANQIEHDFAARDSYN
jgi:4a-hydroxytetrahydrobiopterin dehydratase